MPNAEIRYLHIPAADAVASARFYERVFGWRIRTRDDGSTAFDDTTGEVSGAWVSDRQTAGDTGVLVYIRVDDVDATLEAIVAAGGQIVLPRTLEGESLVHATFRDVAGNVLGVFQEVGSPA